MFEVTWFVDICGYVSQNKRVKYSQRNSFSSPGLTKMDMGEIQPLALSDTLLFDSLGTPLQAPLASPQE